MKIKLPTQKKPESLDLQSHLRKFNATRKTEKQIKIGESKTSAPIQETKNVSQHEAETPKQEGTAPRLKINIKPPKQKQVATEPVLPISETKQIIATESGKAVTDKRTMSQAANEYRKATISKDAIPLTTLNHNRLADSNITFDESQNRAVQESVNERFMCLIGAAGTGKTTVLKRAIDELIHNTRAIDVSGYWKPAHNELGERVRDEQYIPSICLVAFTGQAMQMIRKNFPKSWHNNIMTIHRMLGYVPETYEDFTDSGELVKKRRFVPSYGRSINGFELPWDIIIIDEAGMVAVDLWEKIYDAVKPTTQIKLVGDINQLPPVHGKSILGHAMIKWPVAELTTIHRQKGEKNAIVENAWNVLQGKTPESYPKFNMFQLPTNVQQAQNMVRQVYKGFREKGLLDPDKDVIITPINGDKISDGAPLGQEPLNDILASVDLRDYKRKSRERWLINAGREKKPFAVGDRVMVTKNDHTIGITNGMMGEIVNIEENPEYNGNKQGYGILNLAPNQLPQDHIASSDFKLDVDAFMQDSDKYLALTEEQKEAERGAASHTVTVRFGDPVVEEEADGSIKQATEESSKPMFVKFSTYAEICSLQLSYAITCHKSQGAEFNTVIIICHSTHSKMLYREWLYTAITRAVDRVILLYTEGALAKALANQRISGANLEQKIRSFRMVASIDETKVPPMGTPEKMEKQDD